jgi:hypothetical protein
MDHKQIKQLAGELTHEDHTQNVILDLTQEAVLPIVRTLLEVHSLRGILGLLPLLGANLQIGLLI